MCSLVAPCLGVFVRVGERGQRNDLRAQCLILFLRAFELRPQFIRTFYEIVLVCVARRMFARLGAIRFVVVDADLNHWLTPFGLSVTALRAPTIGAMGARWFQLPLY